MRFYEPQHPIVAGVDHEKKSSLIGRETSRKTEAACSCLRRGTEGASWRRAGEVWLAEHETGCLPIGPGSIECDNTVVLSIRHVQCAATRDRQGFGGTQATRAGTTAFPGPQVASMAVEIRLAQDQVGCITLLESPSTSPTQDAVVVRVGDIQSPRGRVDRYPDWEAQRPAADTAPIALGACEVWLTYHGICDRVTSLS
jgi:hypothetical protein